MRIFIFFNLILTQFVLSAQNRLSTPMEIMAFMEASGTKYEISTLKTKLTNSPKMLVNEGTFVEKSNGRVFAFEFKDTESKKESELRLRIEQLTRKKSYKKEEQKKYYDSILTINSKHAEVRTALAELYLGENRIDEAKKLLEQSIKDNPIDSKAYDLLGQISEKNNQTDEAVKFMLLANIYNRNDPKIAEKLKNLLQKKSLVFYDNWNFNPEYLVRQKKDTIVVEANDFWLTYAFYKAVWNYEKDYQILKKGQKVKDYLFNSEMEAVVGTFLTYSSTKSESVKVIPEMKALEIAVDNEMVEEYVYYEILLREDPLFAAHFSDDLLKRISDYVLKVRTIDHSK